MNWKRERAVDTGHDCPQPHHPRGAQVHGHDVLALASARHQRPGMARQHAASVAERDVLRGDVAAGGAGLLFDVAGVGAAIASVAAPN